MEPRHVEDRGARSAPAQRPWALRRFLSVGTKLASATIALMVVVTAVLYFGLSSYQREHLLQAKETAAVAVTRLFVESCAAPIVFGDNGALSEALAHLARGGDVPYAAVWNCGAAGQADSLLAQVGNQTTMDPGSIPAQLQLKREADRIVLVAPVRDPDEKTVGVAVLTFSLARENQLISQVRSNTLLGSGAFAAGLTLLLLAIARFAIVRPLAKLVVAANAVEQGTQSDLDVHSHDEIGQLAAAFRSMSRAITAREEQIRSRNRDLRLVLDNVADGLLTLDGQARIIGEHSSAIEDWFGAPERDGAFWGYLGRIDRKLAEHFEVGWMMLLDEVLPLAICLEQLPKQFRSAERTFELAYRPISSGERLEQLLVVITDVTQRLARESAQVAEREMMCVFKHILSDGSAFEEFFDEASGLVAQIQAGEGAELSALQRSLHTLKGCSALFGLERLAEHCHTLESAIEEQHAELSMEQKRELAQLWARVGDMRAQFATSAAISVSVAEHRALCAELEAHAPPDLLGRLQAWQFEPASSRLSLLGKQMQELATRFGKAEVRVRVEPTELRLPKKWAPVWAALSHVVRNTVDHGIERAEERVAHGKPREAEVVLALERVEQGVVLCIADDGWGIDWAKIAERAKSLGLPAATPEDLQAALFAQGVSSRSEVTLTSGRGVGLSAVQEAVLELGGHIEVASERGTGTTFRFWLPDTMLSDAPSSARQQVSGALRPRAVHTASRA